MGGDSLVCGRYEERRAAVKFAQRMIDIQNFFPARKFQGLVLRLELKTRTKKAHPRRSEQIFGVLLSTLFFVQ